jgi:hypothetical protein
MTDSNYLPVFSGWLTALGEDVLSLANLLESPDVRPRWRRVSAEALESLLRASDLIPEGLESLGYLEQAFVLRLLSQRALTAGDVEPEASARGGAGHSEVSEVLRGEPDEAPEAFESLEAAAPSGSGDGELEAADALAGAPEDPGPAEAAGAWETSDAPLEAPEASEPPF